MKKKRITRVNGWQTKALLILTAVRDDGKTLGVLVDTDTLLVAALEAQASSGTPAEQMAAVFDRHAHKIVGQGLSLADALVVAESYAKSWAGIEPASVELAAPGRQCDCGEIEAQP